MTVGNLWVLLTNASVRNDAVIAQIASTGLERDGLPDVLLRRLRVRGRAAFALYARRYPMQDHYRAV